MSSDNPTEDLMDVLGPAGPGRNLAPRVTTWSRVSQELAEHNTYVPFSWIRNRPLLCEATI